MAPFDFKSDKHFVASSGGTTLQVHELTKPSLILHPSSIRNAHWKVVANINTTGLDDSVDDDEDDEGLLFFDGHGRIEGRAALTKLAQHLARLHLMVSPGGQCFQEVAAMSEHGGGDYVDFGIHYLRLNDLFSWPHHGVNLARVATWGRSELKYHDPRHEKPVQSKKHPAGGGGGVSKEKYEELRRTVQRKDDEMEKLREEMDVELEKLREEKEGELEKVREELDVVKEAKDEELRKLRKEKDEELRRQLKKKDGEMQMLKKGKDGGVIFQKLMKEKDEEMRKMKEEMEEEMDKLRKEKEDELEKLENEKEEEMLKGLVEKNDELQKLKKEKDEELRRALKKKDEEYLQKITRKGKDGGVSAQLIITMQKEKDEELQKLRREKDEELENLRRDKDEEMEKVLKKEEAETLRKLSEKDDELRKLRKEKDDDEGMRGKASSKYSDQEVEEMKKEKDDQLEKLRNQLSSSAAELTSVKEAQGQYLKSASVLSPGGKVLLGLPSDKEWEFHLSRRRPLPPSTFYCFVYSDRDYRLWVDIFYVPALTEARLNSVFNTYNQVDEGEVTEELLAPPMVTTLTHGNGEFDVNNWWVTKTTDPEGGVTMMAYYDGDRHVFHHQRWGTIRIPYPKGVDFGANRNFYMGNFCGKVRFCFTYRN